MNDLKPKLEDNSAKNVALQPLIKPIPQPAGEQGGPKGLEPTRYGDWEKNGRCSDF